MADPLFYRRSTPPSLSLRLLPPIHSSVASVGSRSPLAIHPSHLHLQAKPDPPVHQSLLSRLSRSLTAAHTSSTSRSDLDLGLPNYIASVSGAPNRVGVDGRAIGSVSEVEDFEAEGGELEISRGEAAKGKRGGWLVAVVVVRRLVNGGEKWRLLVAVEIVFSGGGGDGSVGTGGGAWLLWWWLGGGGSEGVTTVVWVKEVVP